MAGEKNYGASVTRWLDPRGYSWEGVVGQTGKIFLDSEHNLDSDLSSYGMAGIRASIRPSGFIVMHPCHSNDTTGDILGSSYTATANTITLDGRAQGIRAEVNGWEIVVVPLGETRNVTLPEPSEFLGDKCIDFIFLEVWRAKIDSTATNKSAGVPDKIFRYGNVESPHGSNLSDDLIDPQQNAESTVRVQIQHRIRVYSISGFGPEDPVTNPKFLGMTELFAHGANSGEGSRTFSNISSVDPGLWQAGSGDAQSRTDLGSIDGYVYAIPICAIFRRNAAAFNVSTNQNGGVASPGTSDRPDGLFNNIIDIKDIMDLRSHTSTSTSRAHLLTQEALINGNLCTQWEDTQFADGATGIKTLRIDELSTGDNAFAYKIGNFDSIRRRFSDKPTIENYWITLDGQSWAVDPDAVYALPANAQSAGAIITGVLYANWKDLTSNDLDYTITGLGTGTITFNVGPLAGGFSPGDEVIVLLEVSYPAGLGLRRNPSQMFSANRSLFTYVSNAAHFYATQESTFLSDIGTYHVPDGIDYFESFLSAYFEADVASSGFQLVYERVSTNYNCGAIVQGDDVYAIVPDRIYDVLSVTIGAAADINNWTFVEDGAGSRITFTSDKPIAADQIHILYSPIRPLSPSANSSVLVAYEANAPQTVPGNIPGAAFQLQNISIRVIETAPIVYSSIHGPSCWRMSYQYRNPGKHIPVVVDELSNWNGDHELTSSIDMDLVTFSTDTGLASLPVLVKSDLSQIDLDAQYTGVDAEDRVYYKFIDNRTIRPVVASHNMGSFINHRNWFTMIGVINSDIATVGPKGTVVVLVFSGWSVDKYNKITNPDTAADSWSCVGIYRPIGHPLVRL